MARPATAVVCAMALAGCAAQPVRYAGKGPGGRVYDPRLGVYASPRLFEDGEPIPRGGGQYLVGRPYTIGGRPYFPNVRPEGYVVVGTASWYGDAFHGRRTANGEVFDKNSISAAHPTLPLPSYVRVTNLGNNRSMIVRVNDRGPYHGGRVMDVSQRVAEALSFKGAGTARIRVEYVGRASLGGSDDEKLLATLRTDGPARLDGTSDEPTMLASDEAPPTPTPMTRPPVLQAGRAPEAEPAPVVEPPRRRRTFTPVPPQRPFETGPMPAAARTAARPAVPGDAPLALRTPVPHVISFADTESGTPPRGPSRGRLPPLRAQTTDD